MSGRWVCSDIPQVVFLQRHRVRPFLFPFFFISPVHSGHRGGISGMRNTNGHEKYKTAPVSTGAVETSGLTEKLVCASFLTLQSIDLAIASCGDCRI